jgi:acid phosphatase
MAVGLAVAACSSGGASTAGDSGVPLGHRDGGASARDGGSGGHDSGAGGHDSGPAGHDGGPAGHDSGPMNHDSGSGGHDSGSGGHDSGPTLFPAGTICNETGHALTPPAKLKHIILIMEENKNLASVYGNASAPYFTSIAKKCGYSTQYEDNCFTTNLESLPHYLALTSGSNCNTGLGTSATGGTNCVTIDEPSATGHQVSTTSLFDQVGSWKAFMESMPSDCEMTTPASSEYAVKHNPPPFYSALSTCSANDVPIAAVTCASSAPTMTACTGSTSNEFTDDLANDTLPTFTWITPNLQNDMHDGTVTQGDNWLYTYLPIIFQSKPYLNGDVAVFVIWDEDVDTTFGVPEPNAFISPYVTAGTVSSVTMNHFSTLRAMEKAFGISTYLGCASGRQTGDAGACPDGSTADLLAAFNL